MDETSRNRHVQLNSALALVYHVLQHIASSAAMPSTTTLADETKTKTDRANRLFNLRSKLVSALEEAQLVGLAYTTSLSLTSSADITVCTEEAKLRHSRLLERHLRYKVASNTNPHSYSDTPLSSSSTSSSVPSSASATTTTTKLPPHLALLSCEHLGSLFPGLSHCLLSSFVELPIGEASTSAIQASSSKTVSSTASSSSASATAAAAPKGSASAKATTSKATSSTKATASTKATSSAPPAAKASSSSSASPAPKSSSPVDHLALKEHHHIEFQKQMQTLMALTKAEAAPTPKNLEVLLAELVQHTAPSAHLSTPHTRAFLQSLLWSSHANFGTPLRDATLILELSLRLVGVWPSHLKKLELCKKSSPTIAALKDITGATAAVERVNLRASFGSCWTPSSSWTIAHSPTFSFSPNVSGFYLHASTSTTLTQVPLSPQLISHAGVDAASLNIQSTNPTEYAAKLPWSTVLRYFVRGHGYDGMNYFEANASDALVKPSSSEPSLSNKLTQSLKSSPYSSRLLHPLVLMARCSSQDIERFNQSWSDEERGDLFFFQSMPQHSTMHSLLMSTFMRFPNDSLTYLLFMESTFSSWTGFYTSESPVEEEAQHQQQTHAENDETVSSSSQREGGAIGSNNNRSIATDIALQKISSVLNQASTQLSHLQARFNAINKIFSDKSTPGSASSSHELMFIKSMICDSLDLLVVAAYLKASVQLRQYDYKPSVSTCQDVLKRIEVVNGLIQGTTYSASSPSQSHHLSYAFYTTQLRIILGKAFYRLKLFPQAQQAYQLVLDSEPWNAQALLGLSAVFSSDSTFFDSSATTPTSSSSVDDDCNAAYFDLKKSISYLDTMTSFYPSHSWALSLRSHLQSLPFIYLQELNQRSSIHDSLEKSKSSTDPTVMRQGMWLGTLVHGIGEGIVSDSSDGLDALLRSSSDGPIIKDPNSSSAAISSNRLKQLKSRTDDDRTYRNSIRSLAISLISASTTSKSIPTDKDTSMEDTTMGLTEQQIHELMRSAIQARDALKSVHLTHPTWRWTEYFLGVVELVLGNDVEAKHAFEHAAGDLAKRTTSLTSSKSSRTGVIVNANPFALAMRGHLFAKSHVQHGTALDLENCLHSFSSAMAHYGEFKHSCSWIWGVGRGDGIIMLEAAIPMLHILLEKCSKEDTTVSEPSPSYALAMHLLQTISQAGHKWASFKAATYQMRRGDLEAALASILSFLRAFPRHGDANMLLVEIYRRQGKMAAALKSCQKLLPTKASPTSSTSIPPYVAHFIFALLHWKANLVSAAIMHLKLCLSAISSASKSSSSSSSASASSSSSESSFTSTSSIELAAFYLLSRMLLSEAMRMFKEGRVHDAGVAIASSFSLANSQRLSDASSSTSNSPISRFAITKLIGDVAAFRLFLADLRTFTNAESDAILAMKSYNYALQDCTMDGIVSAQIRQDLANVFVSRASLTLLSATSASSLNSPEAIASSSESIKSVLKMLDMAVEETKKSILILTPESSDASAPLPSPLRILLLQAWRMLTSVCTFYLRVRLMVKSPSSKWSIKLSGLGLKHLPQKQSVSDLFVHAISKYVETQKSGEKAMDESKGESDVSLGTTFATVSESKECGRLWAEAGLYWMATGAPMELVKEALKKAKHYDPSLLASWSLHALVLLSEGSSLGQNSKHGTFGYEYQSIHTVMAGLLFSLEEDESSFSSTHPTSLDLYSPSLNATFDNLEHLDEMNSGATSNGAQTFASKSLALVILLYFASKSLDTSSSFETNTKQANDKQQESENEMVATQLAPSAFARRVFALSSRYVTLHPWDTEVGNLKVHLQFAIGIPESTFSSLSSTPTPQSPVLLEVFQISLNSSTTPLVSWDHRPYVFQYRGKTMVGDVSVTPDLSSSLAAHSLSSSGSTSISASFNKAFESLITNAKEILQCSILEKDPSSRLDSFTAPIAEMSNFITKAISPTDTSRILNVSRTLVQLSLSVVNCVLSPIRSCRYVPLASATTLRPVLDQLIGSVKACIDALQAMSLAVALDESSESEVSKSKQRQALFAYEHWICSYLAAKTCWTLSECATLTKDVQPSAATHLLALLQDIAQYEATSSSGVVRAKTAAVLERRIVSNLPLHSDAHLLVSHQSLQGIPLMAFGDFITSVVLTLTTVLMEAEDVQSAAIWSGLRPFNLKSTSPVLSEWLDVPTKDLVKLRWPAEAAQIEARLWSKLPVAMKAVEDALVASDLRAQREARAQWLAQNVSQEVFEDAGEEGGDSATVSGTQTPSSSTSVAPNALSSVSLSSSSSSSSALPSTCETPPPSAAAMSINSPSTTTPTTAASSSSAPISQHTTLNAETIEAALSPQAFGMRRALIASQRAALLRPWDDSNWSQLSISFHALHQ